MCHLSGIQEVAGWILRLASCLSYWFSHEIISDTILSLPVIQVGQLSVTDESMGT